LKVEASAMSKLSKSVRMPKRRVARTLYVKNGKGFKAIGKDDFILPYGVGDYLVRVRRSSRSYRPLIVTKTPISIDYAKIECAMMEMADALARAISKVSELQPKTPLSPREQKGYKAYVRIVGKEGLIFTRKSSFDMANMAIRLLRDGVNPNEPQKCPEGCLDVFGNKVLGQ